MVSNSWSITARNTRQAIFRHKTMTEIILSGEAFDDYLQEHIANIDTSLKETRAYIQSIFKGLLYSEHDLSKQSITLVYSEARSVRDFSKLQELADWIFFARTAFPKSLKASEEYYDTIARSSYYRCYVILDRKWPCFEELADRFPRFVMQLKDTNIFG